MASERMRLWRVAFASLRQASSPSAAAMLIPDLISHLQTLAAKDLSPHEVSADIVFLIETAALQLVHPFVWNSVNVGSRLCGLIMKINSHFQLEYSSTHISSVLNFLKMLLENNCKQTLDACMENRFSATSFQDQLQIDALQVLGHVLYENGNRLSSGNLIVVINLLLRLIKNRCLMSSNTSGQKISHILESRVGVVHIGITAKDWEYQKLLFVALGNLFIRAGSTISKDSWHSIIKVLQEILDFWAFSTERAEDPAASRYYAALLHCVHSALSDPKGSPGEHVAGLVAALRVFFSYGLMTNTHVTDPTINRSKVNRSAKSVNATYQPPHLRKRLTKSAFSVHSAEGQGMDETELGPFSSDSEQSDNEGSVGNRDRKSSKVRISAILSIQALAHADPKSLHAHWTLLLPTHDVLNPRRCDGTLLKSLLFDPVLKTRIAAASTLHFMLEGPLRLFLQVAEYKGTEKSGSFTTLSSSLGQILVQLVAGFVHLIINEPNNAILVSTFKALSLLVSAAPFGRLPCQLLPNIICAVQQKVQDLVSSATDQTAILSVAIDCLGCALNTVPASPEVVLLLTADISARKNDLVLDLIGHAQSDVSPVIRVEALQALKLAVHYYPLVASLYWDSISAFVLCIIEESVSGHPPAGVVDNKAASVLFKGGSVLHSQQMNDDRIVHAALKVLDESLRAISGFKGTSNLPDDNLLESLSPTPIDIFPAAGSISTTGNGRSNITADSSGIMQWSQVLEQHLRLTLNHPASAVRGAVMMCFAGLTSAVFSSQPQPQQSMILKSIINAALEDETPAVRSAACRAIGVVVNFSVVAESTFLKSTTDAVVSLTSDASISVRILASWALANICDSLRNYADNIDQSVIQAVYITTLAECALRLSKDGDKVRANAVRALGNLARFVRFTGEAVHMPEVEPTNKIWMCPLHPWLGRIIQALISCGRVGNVKVQWNVCHALGNLLLNRTINLSRMSWTVSVYSILLHLLHDSTNLKIRIHAAAALAVPIVREDYGSSFNEVLQGLLTALESLGSGQVTIPSSFRYINALKEQLTTSSLHVLGLIVPGDYSCLRDILLKHAAFLEEWLKSSYKRSVSFDDCRHFSGSEEEKAENYITVKAENLCYFCKEKKLLRPPKDRLWYELIGEEGAFCRKESPSDRIACIIRASKALNEMFRYGGNTSFISTIEHIIDKNV